MRTLPWGRSRLLVALGLLIGLLWLGHAQSTLATFEVVWATAPAWHNPDGQAIEDLALESASLADAAPGARERTIGAARAGKHLTLRTSDAAPRLAHSSCITRSPPGA